MENNKEKEPNLFLSKRNETKTTINKSFHTIFSNSKISLSKLLQSVNNYKKRTRNILLPTELNNKKAQQINSESNIKSEQEQKKENIQQQEQKNIEKEEKNENKKLSRNPSISYKTSHTSGISNKNENKKFASIASFNFSKNNGRFQIKQRLLNSRNNKSFYVQKNKKINFELNDKDNKNEKNEEMLKIIEELLYLEQNIVFLLTKIKMPEEFHKECTIWINSFTKTCLYEFKKYFNDNYSEYTNNANNYTNNTNNSFITNQNNNNNNNKDFFNIKKICSNTLNLKNNNNDSSIKIKQFKKLIYSNRSKTPIQTHSNKNKNNEIKNIENNKNNDNNKNNNENNNKNNENNNNSFLDLKKLINLNLSKTPILTLSKKLTKKNKKSSKNSDKNSNNIIESERAKTKENFYFNYEELKKRKNLLKHKNYFTENNENKNYQFEKENNIKNNEIKKIKNQLKELEKNNYN